MPMRQITGNFVGIATTAIITIPGDVGVLKAACLSQASGELAANYRRPAQYYAAIYISIADTSQPFPYIMLAQGRIGSYTAISWTGHIIREPGQLLFGLLCGNIDCVFTLRSFTEI
jgi:hypothetical protein